MRRLLSLLSLATLLSSQTAYAYPVWQFDPALLRGVTDTQELKFMDTAEVTPPVLQISAWKSVTRANFVAAVVAETHKAGLPASCFALLSPSNYRLLFADVPKTASYGPALCAAMRDGYVSGYRDATFRPDQPINVAEASKILAKAFGLSSDNADAKVLWYAPYVNALKARGIIAKDVRLSDPLTGNQMAEMLAKIRER